MKVRVFKALDGRVVYNWPSKKYQGDVSLCPIPKALEGLEFVIMDEADLPPSNSETGNFHEMIHFDGEVSKENLKQDKAWEKCLMPAFMIREKHLARLKRKISESRLNSGLAFEYYLEHEGCKGWDEHQLYRQALENLDEDGLEKPVVREKLNAKLKEAPHE